MGFQSALKTPPTNGREAGVKDGLIVAKPLDCFLTLLLGAVHWGRTIFSREDPFQRPAGKAGTLVYEKTET